MAGRQWIPWRNSMQVEEPLCAKSDIEINFIILLLDQRFPDGK